MKEVKRTREGGAAGTKSPRLLRDPGDVRGCREAVGDPVRTDRLIAQMAVVDAGPALLLDVRNLAAGADVPIPAGDTATRESSKSEKSHEAHRSNPTNGPAIHVPEFLDGREFRAPENPRVLGRRKIGRLTRCVFLAALMDF